jgi:hypothetical protein
MKRPKWGLTTQFWAAMLESEETEIWGAQAYNKYVEESQIEGNEATLDKYGSAL